MTPRHRSTPPTPASPPSRRGPVSCQAASSVLQKIGAPLLCWQGTLLHIGAAALQVRVHKPFMSPCRRRCRSVRWSCWRCRRTGLRGCCSTLDAARASAARPSPRRATTGWCASSPTEAFLRSQRVIDRRSRHQWHWRLAWQDYLMLGCAAWGTTVGCRTCCAGSVPC